MSDGQTELAEQIEADHLAASAAASRRLAAINERLASDPTPMERTALIAEREDLLILTDDSPEPPTPAVGDAWMQAGQ